MDLRGRLWPQIEAINYPTTCHMANGASPQGRIRVLPVRKAAFFWCPLSCFHAAPLVLEWPTLASMRPKMASKKIVSPTVAERDQTAGLSSH